MLRPRAATAAPATGNRVLPRRGDRARLGALPSTLADWIGEADEADGVEQGDVDAVLFEGEWAAPLALGQALAAREGKIVPVFAARPDGAYPPEWPVLERSVGTDTTAAGGDAASMIG